MRRRTLVGVVAATAAFAIAVGAPSAPAGAVVAQATAPVSGGGASFPQLELEQWRADVSRPPYNLKVDYQAAGSTFGRQKYLSGQLDYGVSDIEFQADEQGQLAASARKNFVYVPVSAGGMGLMYNLTGTDGRRITNLKLSQRNACRLFTEENIAWNDPAIVAENPGVPLPADPVRPVVRSDGSGTSFVFSEYCISTAPDVWRAFISLVQARSPDSATVEFRNGQPTSTWPNGYGRVSTAYASDGVANTVANDVAGKGTITYNEAGFATERGFPNAYLRNAAGVYLQPDPPKVSKALAYATGRANGTFSLDYQSPDPDAYFPSSYSYVIAQTSGFDPAKGATLGTFLYYAVTAGQRRAESLNYARLSTVLVQLAISKITQIPGAPPPPTDLGGAPPPPPTTIAKGGAGAAVPGAKTGTAAGGAKGSTAGGAKSGAGGTPGAAGAATNGAGTATTVPGAGTPAAVEGASATRDANGQLKLDVSNLPTAAAASPASQTAKPEDPVSDKDALWTFALGMALVAGGTAVGAALKNGKDRAVGGAA